VAVVLCLGALGVVGARVWAGSDARTADERDDAARARWESREPTAYSFDYTSCGGMCAYCLVHVTVDRGRVTSARGREGQCPPVIDAAPTVEDVFAMEERDRAAETTASYVIRYDPTWGFPASVTIRCPDGWMDCGTGYRVAHFRAGP
jgi:hypothetical protein